MIDAKTLVDLVRNTAPYLFDEYREKVALPQFRYVEILNQAAIEATTVEWTTEFPEFYQLCLSAHFATVGTFVPTDVDVAIRQKLWKGVHHEKRFVPLWNQVQEFAGWDESLVSKRVVMTPSGKKLSGHQGEWFSIAMGAYGTALKVAPDFIPEIRGQIESVVKNHEAALIELQDAFSASPTIVTARAYFDGVASVAHNLGDLDRMIDAWEIEDTDVLKRRVYRSGHEDAKNPRPAFLKAGEVYQAMLASENHRHFALREPKGLRRSPKFLLNYGPFFDDWGTLIVETGVNTGILSEGDFREVVEALVVGWKKLNPKSIYVSQGYARALCGIMKALPRGREDLENLVPPVIRKELREGGLRTLTGVSRSQFESQWVRKLSQLLA